MHQLPLCRPLDPWISIILTVKVAQIHLAMIRTKTTTATTALTLRPVVMVVWVGRKKLAIFFGPQRDDDLLGMPTLIARPR